MSREGANAARAVLHDLGVVDAAMCATLKGWLIGLLTLSGVKNPQAEHVQCRVHGAPTCVYTMTWT